MYKSDKVLYKNTGNSSIAELLSKFSRNNVLNLFFRINKISSKTKVIDLGVSNYDNAESTNFFMKNYPFPKKIVCTGIHSKKSFKKTYKQFTYEKIEKNKKLPFKDKNFDVLFSNAVLEHVGSSDQQEKFIQESIRIANKIFIVFPNRLFPIEHHTFLPFLHWFPKIIFRKILVLLNMKFWALESNLNHLDYKFVKNICKKYKCSYEFTGLRLGVFSSNLVIYK